MTPAIPDHVSRNDVASAGFTIHACQADLNRQLSAGERRDLVADNFPTWTLDYVRDVVEAILIP